MYVPDSDKRVDDVPELYTGTSCAAARINAVRTNRAKEYNNIGRARVES